MTGAEVTDEGACRGPEGDLSAAINDATAEAANAAETGAANEGETEAAGEVGAAVVCAMAVAGAVGKRALPPGLFRMY